jgi:hypothetical protein
VDLCRKLEAAGAKFLVIGGFAMRAHGLARQTFHIDLLLDPSLDNEARAIAVLGELPDGAAKEITPGDIAEHTVVRVADEIIVDLMARASGITYAEAATEVVGIVVEGVRIPVASPSLLLRMKRRANRDKDLGDVRFLEQLLRTR